MTIVQVDQECRGSWAEKTQTQSQVYVDIPIDSDKPGSKSAEESNKIRQAAFRFVNKRKEMDSSEIYNHTRILPVKNMTKDQFDLMFTHIN